MKLTIVFLFIAVSIAGAQDTVEAHRAAAKAAAGQDLIGIYEAACPADNPTPGRGRGAAGQRSAPAREEWYAEPVKVFDNLYFVGTKVHGAWAVTTSDGIIVIDALYDYAAEAEIAEGLKKLGLDPAKIRYVIVSHGHGDHHGGAKFLQDQFKPHVIMSATDWDMVERDTRNPVPRRDMVATDGQKLTLGGTALTLYVTPGHTPGTISTLVPIKDGGKAHLAAEWGGTVIGVATPIPMLQAYIKSAARFRDVAEGAGADVIITNHTGFDGTRAKLDAIQKRKPGDPNPYVAGKDAVRRYLTVAEECGKATLLMAQARQ
jgi:metallo-beta-lactamase class B